MRISDWSSVVCSSDLTSPAFSIHAHLGDGGVVSAGSAVELDVPGTHRPCPIYLPSSLRSSTLVATRHVAHHRAAGAHRMLTSALHEQLGADPRPSPASVASGLVTALERCCAEGMEIGRASCRERVCQYG